MHHTGGARHRTGTACCAAPEASADGPSRVARRGEEMDAVVATLDGRIDNDN
jgi:hypothetical protein